MRVSGIPVEESFRITSEQIDGAIKDDFWDENFFCVVNLNTTNTLIKK
jgi:hypothetical protein